MASRSVLPATNTTQTSVNAWPRMRTHSDVHCNTGNLSFLTAHCSGYNKLALFNTQAPPISSSAFYKLGKDWASMDEAVWFIKWNTGVGGCSTHRETVWQWLQQRCASKNKLHLKKWVGLKWRPNTLPWVHTRNVLLWFSNIFSQSLPTSLWGVYGEGVLHNNLLHYVHVSTTWQVTEAGMHLCVIFILLLLFTFLFRSLFRGYDICVDLFIIHIFLFNPRLHEF